MSTHRAIATTTKGVVEEIQRETEQPGPDEVLIAINYAALIAFDTYQVDRSTFGQDYPLVLGFSGSGRVARLGENVKDLTVGDRVTAFTFPDSKKNSTQEYVLVYHGVVAKVPENVGLKEAATVPDNFVSAFWTLFGSLKLPVPQSWPATKPPRLAHEPILVYGAASSVGQYIIQLLKGAGYLRILATASPRNHALLKDLGATQVFDYGDPALASQLLVVAGLDTIKIVIDPIASSQSLKAIAKVAGKGSRLALLLPVKEGETVTNAPETEMTLDIPQWTRELLPEVEIIPVATFTYQSNEEFRDNLLPKILPELLQSGVIRPNRVRLLNEGTLQERVEQGLDLLRNNKISGEKVVVEVKKE